MRKSCSPQTFDFFCFPNIPYKFVALENLKTMSDQTVFGLSCSNGEPFYACDYGTRFLGCCTRGGVDVCANGCELDSLQAASFDQQYYSNITQNDCNTTIRAGEWYTCEDTAPPFLGCCASNACMYTGGCPDDQLVPAQLSGNETEIAPFLPILMRQNTATKSRTGAIIGGVVGGVVFAILIGFVVCYRIRKLRKHVIQQSNPKHDNKGIEFFFDSLNSYFSALPDYYRSQHSGVSHHFSIVACTDLQWSNGYKGYPTTPT